MWIILLFQKSDSDELLYQLKNVNPYNLFYKKPEQIMLFKRHNYYLMEGYFREDGLKRITIILDSSSYEQIIRNYGKYRENLLMHYLTLQAFLSYLLYSDFASTVEIPQSFVKPLRVLIPIIYTSYSYALTLKLNPITGSMVYASSYGAISSYLKNYFVLDTYERVIWSILENNLYFVISYYLNPEVSHITRCLFLNILFYYNYYAFENSIFNLKSSTISSILSFSNILASKIDKKSTNGDVLFEAFSSFSMNFSIYNLTKDHKKSAISSNIGYALGYFFSQKNNLSLSETFAIGVSTFILTYTLSEIFANHKNNVYSLSPLFLYLNYFLFNKLF